MRVQLPVVFVMAFVAGVFTQLPGPGTPPSRAAFAATASGDAVIVWNAHAGEAAMKACIAPLDDPFHESRIYAMMHIAIHDALNAIDRRFQPYTFDKRVEPGAISRSRGRSGGARCDGPTPRSTPSRAPVHHTGVH